MWLSSAPSLRRSTNNLTLSSMSLLHMTTKDCDAVCYRCSRAIHSSITDAISLADVGEERKGGVEKERMRRRMKLGI
ncbi:hypothetical protein Lalb_Chr22g0358111 [Lupinus albus]|uniref:Uncharacterized protein n=1 Tax=Lupinus albus TaxID=3870 RepID=A0A6A4NMS8_LUPAL|nr:hypothetical protein Lalb_Chr22g0358111 [Lupinus albus]